MVDLGHADEACTSMIGEYDQLNGMRNADLYQLVTVLTARHCLQGKDNCSCSNRQFGITAQPEVATSEHSAT